MLFAASAFMSSLTDIIAGADPGVGALLLANIVNITLQHILVTHDYRYIWPSDDNDESFRSSWN
jgi:hypothetical protein